MMLPKRLIFGLVSLWLMIRCSDCSGRCGSFMRGVYPCPPDWKMGAEECYKKFGTNLPWAEAKQECIKMGGDLVMPQSQEETEFIVKHVYHWFWINCNDLEIEGTWVCQDGTTEVEYRKWKANQPSNGGGREHCAYAGKSGWNDVPCQNNSPVICQQLKLQY